MAAGREQAVVFASHLKRGMKRPESSFSPALLFIANAMGAMTYLAVP